MKKTSAQRHTRQKDAVLRALRGSGDFMSAQDLHQQMSQTGVEVGLATVYRQLKSMAESGDVDTIQFNGQQLFRLCEDHAHHHHLVCEHCGKTVEIEPPDELWVRKVAGEHGFTVHSHTLEVFGLCEDCRAAA